MRRRLDVELVRRGLAASRAEAQALVDAGDVTVGGAPAAKSSRMVGADEAVEVLHRPRFVSRGGLKLEAALDAFGIDPAGRRCIDAGASTGGFTDCLLQRGAAEVVAIDVGRHQLHERIRADPRVAVHEQTSVRGIDPAAVGGPGSLLVADLSFISLRLVLPDLVALTAGPADLVVLVKPQFEAGRAEADRGRGVIRDVDVHRRVLGEVLGAAAALGARPAGLIRSPIRGADGNVEYLAHLRVDAHGEAATGPLRSDVGAPPPTTVDAERVADLVEGALAAAPSPTRSSEAT